MTTKIENSQLSVTIKHLGAELCSIQNQDKKEYMWQADPAFWAKHAPILFPVVGTLKNNSYHYQQKEYQLSRHGFARDMNFKVLESSNSKVTFSLEHNEETLAIYPFQFELQISYSIENSTLIVDYRVINNSETIMPFSIGAHPAFALEGNFNDYNLVFEKDEQLTYHLLANDLLSENTKTLNLTDKKLDLSYDLFANDALIFKSILSKELTIQQKGKDFLKVAYSGFPDLGIWTKMQAPFICIEPWYGYSDTQNATGDLFEKEGIQTLLPEQSFNAQYTIEILKN
ncbi:MAG: aldose 1-epimerase family protein [Flavobacterium sp.]